MSTDTKQMKYKQNWQGAEVRVEKENRTRAETQEAGQGWKVYWWVKEIKASTGTQVENRANWKLKTYKTQKVSLGKPSIPTGKQKTREITC